MNRSLDTAKTAFQQALTLLRTGDAAGAERAALGEIAGQAGVTQGDVAATMLQYLGLDHRDFNPHGGPPIPGSFAPAAAPAGAN